MTPRNKGPRARIAAMRQRILEMHAQGLNHAQMAEALRVPSRSNVNYHTRIMGLPSPRGAAARRRTA